MTKNENEKTWKNGRFAVFFFYLIQNELFFLFISGILIFANWSIWIYAISVDQVINASFGYFIMPILSVFLGFFFFKEKLNSKRILSISLVLLSIVYLIFVDFKSIPWVGIGVALSWGFYNLVRKKISVSTDIGLFIESIFILPFILVAFYFITKNNLNNIINIINEKSPSEINI